MDDIVEKIEDLRYQAEVLKAESAHKQSEFMKIKNIIRLIESQLINKVSDRNITVSDHAIIRYMERVLNIDTNKFKEEILSSENVKKINQLKGNGMVKDGKHKLLIKDNRVITILPIRKTI